jgi:hypothetical protein
MARETSRGDTGVPSMLSYFSQVSVFDSLLALLLVLAADWAFTLIHVLQEWKGEKVPLWRVFGAIVGTALPDKLGFVGFTLFLWAAQWLIGLMAIAGWLPIVGSLTGHMGLAIWALGALIGARIGDSVVSHWVPYGLGYRPNPGLSSTVLYVAEAIFIVWAFQKGLALQPAAAWCGVVIGAGFFVLVLPGLWALRWLVPAWRRDAWVRGQPMPAWATT